MRGFGTFLKKEMTEMLRTYRAAVLMAVSLIFGIMNPLIAKLTPVLMKQFSEDFAEQGFVINKITVTAMDSWAQFDKNFPMLLLVAIVLLAGCYVKEYAKGTLIPLVTKGLSRRAVVLSKLLTQLLAWTVSFCLYACRTFSGPAISISPAYWKSQPKKVLPGETRTVTSKKSFVTFSRVMFSPN